MLRIDFVLCSFVPFLIAAPIIFGFQQSDYFMQYEHVDLQRYNKNYLRDVKVTTFKFNRTNMGINGSFVLLKDVNSDLEVISQAYKFMSNEFRLFPIRIQLGLCKAISGNEFGLGQFYRCGNFIGCPLKKGEYHICNFAPDETKFPPFIPTGRYMVELQMMHLSTELSMIRAYAAVNRPFH